MKDPVNYICPFLPCLTREQRGFNLRPIWVCCESYKKSPAPIYIRHRAAILDQILQVPVEHCVGERGYKREGAAKAYSVEQTL